MNVVNAVVRRVVGLFIDDGPFATSIVVWLVLSWGLLSHMRANPGRAGFVLFAGFALVLMFDTLRRSRRLIQGQGRPMGAPEAENLK